ncbi:hypothetical protein, partial [Salmonella sp. hn-h4]|uniref:hypothetical protein n=1 Tax=Salmonella sp. hn-h4 TaxID=2582612 RepID=UPI0013AD2C41
GRIAANHDLTVYAGTLDNIASNILAGNNATFSGASLNNQSYQNSVENKYVEYHYTGRLGSYTKQSRNSGDYKMDNSLNSKITYNLTGAPEYETL